MGSVAFAVSPSIVPTTAVVAPMAVSTVPVRWPVTHPATECRRRRSVNGRWTIDHRWRRVVHRSWLVVDRWWRAIHRLRRVVVARAVTNHHMRGRQVHAHGPSDVTVGHGGNTAQTQCCRNNHTTKQFAHLSLLMNPNRNKRSGASSTPRPPHLVDNLRQLADVKDALHHSCQTRMPRMGMGDKAFFAANADAMGEKKAP